MIRALSLTLAALLTVVPLPVAMAQTDPSARTAELRAEQAVPRKPAAFDPKNFDKFTGTYELFPNAIIWVTRNGSHYLTRMTGEVVIEVFPESQTKFFSNEIQAQYSFDSDAGGKITAIVLHKNGMELRGPRISAETGRALEAAMLARIKAGRPAPGTEASLRRYIASLEKGKPNYQEMTPDLAGSVRATLPALLPLMVRFGPLKSIAFKSVDDRGMDVYDVVFESGRATWMIAPLTADGKVYGRGFVVRN
jgi:hypothetical protein